MVNVYAVGAAFAVIALVGVAHWRTTQPPRPLRSSLQAPIRHPAPLRPPAIAATEPIAVAALPGVRTTFWRVGEHDTVPDRRASFVSPSGASYTFSFVRFPDGRCRAYIVRAPDYGRPAPLLDTHRLHDDQRRLHYVCFTPEPTEPRQLLTVVAHWMKATDTFRRTGKFPLPAWSS